MILNTRGLTGRQTVQTEVNIQLPVIGWGVRITLTETWASPYWPTSTDRFIGATLTLREKNQHVSVRVRLPHSTPAGMPGTVEGTEGSVNAFWRS